MELKEYYIVVINAAKYWLDAHTNPWGWMEANGYFLADLKNEIAEIMEKNPGWEGEVEIFEEEVFPELIMGNYRQEYPHFDTVVEQCNDVVATLLGDNPFEAAVVLLRANSLIHCGGALLSEYGNIPFAFVDEVSQKGLENVFGPAELDRFFNQFSDYAEAAQEALERIY
jgi:hypothetical protein